MNKQAYVAYSASHNNTFVAPDNSQSDGSHSNADSDSPSQTSSRRAPDMISKSINK